MSGTIFSSIASYYTPNDNFRHAIVATTDGNVSEIYFHPNSINISPPLANFGGIVGIAGFYTPDDHYRHAIVATHDGNLREIYFQPAKGIFVTGPLANFTGITGIDGFYTSD